MDVGDHTDLGAKAPDVNRPKPGTKSSETRRSVYSAQWPRAKSHVI